MRGRNLDRHIDNVVQNCVAVRLRTLNRFVSGLYDEQLRPLGLKVSQLNILVATAKLKTARPARVCELLCLDESTLSRNVERMRVKGWLEVVADNDDARTQPFRLTNAGRDLLQKAMPGWHKAQKVAERLLGSSGVDALRRAARMMGTV
jgi:DNA-binding MarR family transcriptional regulator